MSEKLFAHQSQHPAVARVLCATDLNPALNVSIHAPRVGGDSRTPSHNLLWNCFSPRPRVGAPRPFHRGKAKDLGFNPRLPRGGRR